MAKFSIARVPYYISVLIFAGLAGLVSLINNTVALGHESDFFLALMVVCAVVALMSVWYLMTARAGGDDEVGMEIAGLPLSKPLYYLLTLGLCGWRFFAGYGMNHATIGLGSAWGAVWMVGAAGIALFTWGNYRSYQQKQAAKSA